MPHSNGNLNIRQLVALSTAKPVAEEEIAGLIGAAEMTDSVLGRFIRNQLTKMNDAEIGDMFKQKIKRCVMAHGTDEDKFTIQKIVP